MFIQFEETPNPNTLKFLPGTQVMDRGVRDYQSSDDAKNSPLALELFKVDGVTGVFLGSDFVSVTKSPANDWGDVKPVILGKIMEHFTTKQPVLNENDQDEKVDTSDNSMASEIEKQIMILIEERVKPAVAMDGGNIEFESFVDGVVYLRLEGACSGCPSSTVTLKMGIENMLKHYIPEVARVEAVNPYIV